MSRGGGVFQIRVEASLVVRLDPTHTQTHYTNSHTHYMHLHTHTHTHSVCALAGHFITTWAIVQGSSFALKSRSCVSSSKACETRHLQKLPLHIKTEIWTQQSSLLEMQKKRSSYVWVMEQMSRKSDKCLECLSCMKSTQLSRPHCTKDLRPPACTSYTYMHARVCVRVRVFNVQIYLCFHAYAMCGRMCVCTAVHYLNLHSDLVTIHHAFSLAPTHSLHSVQLRTYECIMAP